MVTSWMPRVAHASDSLLPCRSSLVAFPDSTSSKVACPLTLESRWVVAPLVLMPFQAAWSMSPSGMIPQAFPRGYRGGFQLGLARSFFAHVVAVLMSLLMLLRAPLLSMPMCVASGSVRAATTAAASALVDEHLWPGRVFHCCIP